MVRPDACAEPSNLENEESYESVAYDTEVLMRSQGMPKALSNPAIAKKPESSRLGTRIDNVNFPLYVVFVTVEPVRALFCARCWRKATPCIVIPLAT